MRNLSLLNGMCVVLGLMVALFGVALILSTACSDDSTNPKKPEPVGRIVSNTGCKATVAQTFVPLDSAQDCLEWIFDGKGVLQLKHVNAAFNCCPEHLLATIVVTGDTISITEDEQLDQGGCRCLCLYDVNYQITNVSPGVYTAVIDGMYLGGDWWEQGSYLTCELDLTEAGIGSCCVWRHDYPWRTSAAVEPAD